MGIITLIVVFNMIILIYILFKIDSIDEKLTQVIKQTQNKEKEWFIG